MRITRNVCAASSRGHVPQLSLGLRGGVASPKVRPKCQPHGARIRKKIGATGAMTPSALQRSLSDGGIAHCNPAIDETAKTDPAEGLRNQARDGTPLRK